MEQAESGQAGLDRLREGLAVDLVVLDQNMPGLSGVETLKQLRATHPDLPVILSTGRVESEVESVQGEGSRVWILQKPFTARELQAAVLTACP